jgi:hypothetical protein
MTWDDEVELCRLIQKASVITSTSPSGCTLFQDPQVEYTIMDDYYHQVQESLFAQEYSKEILCVDPPGTSPLKVVFKDGTIVTYDEQYRKHSFNDQPCMLLNDGSKMWCDKGRVHRLKGPAVLFEDGTALWYRYDKLHKNKGPAVCPVLKGLDEVYWYFGKRACNKQQFLDKTWRRRIVLEYFK